MSGFIDLHCHWLPGIDDGAPTLESGLQILAGLRSLGFELVMATPHMRPGLFDNDSEALVRAYRDALPLVQETAGLPRVGLACEHYFDDVVYQRLTTGRGLPYPGERAVLLEFYEMDLPPSLNRLLETLDRRGLKPVIAHPERYHAIWKNPTVLERMLDAGAVALLDVAALAGKYGQQPKATAELLMSRSCYYAACSDAHRPGDLVEVKAGMDAIRQGYGEDELMVLFHDGPREILSGTACHKG